MSHGLLLVTMEPPPAMSEEFQDWYDTEHVPERLRLPGFRTATRWICRHGWPRYIALYDLDSPAALDTPDYLAVSGDKLSPWSRRVLPRTIGRVRVVAEQIAPGTADLPSPDLIACLVVARYPEPLGSSTSLLLPGLLQLRTFRCVDGAAHGWVLAAFSRVIGSAELETAFSTLGPAGASLINVYRLYTR